MSDTTSTASQSAAATLVASRALLTASAVKVFQPVGAPIFTVNPPLGISPVQYTINPRNVGLLRRLLVRVEMSVTVPTGTNLTPGPWGPAALLGAVKFTDLNNLDRHNTDGIHLASLASVRNRTPAGSAELTDTPLGFGNVMGGGISWPGAVTGAGQTVKVAMVYEVPLAYMDGDYRGAIYLGTTQASTALTVTVNGAFFQPAANNSNDVNYGFQYTGSMPTVNSVKITTYQDYLDQIPQLSSGALALPWSDMATIYQLLKTSNDGVSANSDFTIPFANLRTYQSMFAVYNNGGSLNPGTDINAWKLQSANLYSYFDQDPFIISYRTRQAIGVDCPAGMYYFGFRDRPIDTGTYGNTNLVLNANVANSGAGVITYSEYFSNSYTLNAQSA